MPSTIQEKRHWRSAICDSRLTSSRLKRISNSGCVMAISYKKNLFMEFFLRMRYILRWH
jgi:hypothetical protein